MALQSTYYETIYKEKWIQTHGHIYTYAYTLIQTYITYQNTAENSSLLHHKPGIKGAHVKKESNLLSVRMLVDKIIPVRWTNPQKNIT